MLISGKDEFVLICSINRIQSSPLLSSPRLSNMSFPTLSLEIDGYKDISLFKYADDSTVLVTITKDSPDISDIALSKFMDWAVANDMHYNTSKCKELIMRKRGNSTVYPTSHNIKRYNNISLLGVTIQGNCKFGLHVKAKFHEANKCLFVIRSLRSPQCNFVIMFEVSIEGSKHNPSAVQVIVRAIAFANFGKDLSAKDFLLVIWLRI